MEGKTTYNNSSIPTTVDPIISTRKRRKVQRATSYKDRHKNVKCLVCRKSMRSDTLKRHSKTHKDLLSLSHHEVKEELRTRHLIQIEREAKRQNIVEIVLQEGWSIPKELAEHEEFDEEDVRERLLKNNQIYLNKIEMGKKIADIIQEGVILEESLIKDHNEALDLYRNFILEY